MLPTPAATGLLSRSNSQPDLTLNLDKATPNSNNYCINNNYYYYNNYYNTANNTISSSNNINSNSFTKTNVHNNHNYYSNISPNQVNFVNVNVNSNNVSNKAAKSSIRRHPSLSYKTSISECNTHEEEFLTDFNIIDYLNSANPSTILTETNAKNPTSSTFTQQLTNNINMSSSCSATSGISSLTTASLPEDDLFLGTDALTDFISNCGTFSDIFDDLPDLEDLMSLVTFESSASGPAATAAAAADTISSSHFNTADGGCLQQQQHQPLPQKQTSQCDLNLLDLRSMSNSSRNDCNPLSNYYDYCNTESSIINQNSLDENNLNESNERTTRSAPPSPTPQKKKQRPTANLSWNKSW